MYNTQNLLQGNNLVCFMFQVAAFESPDIITIGGILNDLTGALSKKMSSAFLNALSGLSCPQLAKYYDSQLSIFPGYTKYNDKQGAYPPK